MISPSSIDGHGIDDARLAGLSIRLSTIFGLERHGLKA
jgi:hypothetical protein